MARRARWVALGLGVVVALALVASARRPADGPSQQAIDDAAAELDARLREAAAGASSRAQTLADLPRLALAVATDAATVRDLTADELAFRPKLNETIEIGQLPRDGGRPQSLLRIPPDATVEVPLAEPGVHILDVGDVLRVAAVVTLEPRARADELAGVVAVSWLADLGLAAALIAPLGGARIETPSGAIELGGPLLAAETVSVAIGAPGAGVELVAPAPRPAGWRTARLALALAAASLGLALAVLLTRAGPAALPTVTQFRGRPSAAPPGGTRIGPYQVIERLGSGGMADVYRARVEGEAGFERTVALKVMHDDLCANPRFVSHFLDEARLAPRLAHPNIVAITDLGRAGEKYVIAMELIDGADLERLILSIMQRGGEVPIGVALAIVRRVCDGLHYAHSALDGDGNPLDLVHRDVKSANVFVAKNGAVKVGDFGIAKIAAPTRAAKTEIGEVKGTVAYMAPEHRLGQEIDRRADVYAVGAICYELLTGRQINLDLALLAVRGRDGWPHLPPPSQVRPDVPVDLDAVVFRAMAYEREARYPTCEALEQAIGEVVERHRLAASDKAIAAWVTDEIARLPRPAIAALPDRVATEARS